MPASLSERTDPRILIVRLSAIGDVLHGLPVLNALRDAMPRARLGWLVEKRASTLLEGHSSLDDLMTLPRGWLKSPRELWRLRRRLRAFGPDVAIDLQGLAKSAIAARLSGARRRIGFGCEKGRELSTWLNNDLVRSTARHIIDCNLELLRPLGIERPAVRFSIPERPADAAWAEELLRREGLEGGYAVLNPGAGWPSKLWPADRYAAVAVWLAQARGLPTLAVWAGAQERSWAEQITAGSQGHARLAPPTSLLQLAAITRQAKLFVGSDTGPLHLAVALGTPCVGLFGPMPAERNGPYGPQHVAVQKAQFHGTSRQRRNAPASLMEAISPEDVCEACSEVLRRTAGQAA